jgi:hypothetical protein
MAKKPRNPAFFSEVLPVGIHIPTKGGKPLPGKVVEIPIMQRRMNEDGSYSDVQIGVNRAYRVDDGETLEQASSRAELAYLLQRRPTRPLPGRTKWSFSDIARLSRKAPLSQSVPSAFRPREDWQDELNQDNAGGPVYTRLD